MTDGTADTIRTRRRFIGEAAAIAAGGAIAATAAAQAPGTAPGAAAAQASEATGGPAPAQAPARVTTERLSDSLAVVTGPDGSNSLVIDAPAGLVLIDGGHAAWAPALLSAAESAFPERPYRALVNTHWHPEQTGANRALGERGVEILAHENTRLWLGVEIHQRWSGMEFAPLPPAARPTTGFHDTHTRDVAGRELRFVYMLHAHTDGDIAVYLPDEDVLFTGGHVSNAGWPVVDWWTGGWIGGMLDGFDTLATLVSATTRIVPSRGPVMSPAELAAQHEMYLTIFERLEAMLRQALAPDEVLAAKPTAEFDARFGDPALFVRLAFESLWGHLRDAHDTRLQNIA